MFGNSSFEKYTTFDRAFFCTMQNNNMIKAKLSLCLTYNMVDVRKYIFCFQFDRNK